MPILIWEFINYSSGFPCLIVMFCFASFIGNPLLCGNWLGSICGPYEPKSRGKNLTINLTVQLFSPLMVVFVGQGCKIIFQNLLRPAIFSRAAVICLTLGFITLLSMVTVAIYKSNQQKQLMKGSQKNMQGMLPSICFHCILPFP